MSFKLKEKLETGRDNAEEELSSYDITYDAYCALKSDGTYNRNEDNINYLAGRISAFKEMLEEWQDFVWRKRE